MITENVDQAVLNLFKIDNKDIKKEIVKIKASQYTSCSCTLEKHLKKVLNMSQVVNKETQSLLLTFNRFHILLTFLLLTLSICLLGKVFQEFEEQQWLFHTFPSKRIHAQIQQRKP